MIDHSIVLYGANQTFDGRQHARKMCAKKGRESNEFLFVSVNVEARCVKSMALTLRLVSALKPKRVSRLQPGSCEQLAHMLYLYTDPTIATLLCAICQT